MRFVTDRCIVCGTPRRPNATNDSYVLDQGDILVSDERKEPCTNYYWFCSEKCYAEAVYQYMPEEYRPDGYERDSEYLRIRKRYSGDFDEITGMRKNYAEEYDEYMKNWKTSQEVHFFHAKYLLYDRLIAEQRISFKQRVEEALRAELKEGEKQKALLDKKIEADNREYAKLQAQYKELERMRDEELERVKPKPIPPHIRFEHTHILGPSGSGKSSLIQQLLMEELYNCQDNTNLLPAYIIIDQKGTMVDRLSRLAVFARGNRYGNSIIIIDPTKRPLPALDIFHHPTIPGDQHQRVRVLNQLIETFAYIFSTANARLTQRQSIPFTYVVRLVFFMSGNLETMMDILEDNPKDRRFYPYMRQLGNRMEVRGASSRMIFIPSASTKRASRSRPASTR